MAELLPEGSNLCGYIGNDPVNGYDPTGFWEVKIGVGAGVAGSISFGRNGPKNNRKWDFNIGLGGGAGALLEFTPDNSGGTKACDDYGNTTTDFGLRAEFGANYGVASAGVELRAGLRDSDHGSFAGGYFGVDTQFGTPWKGGLWHEQQREKHRDFRNGCKGGNNSSRRKFGFGAFSLYGVEFKHQF